MLEANTDADLSATPFERRNDPSPNLLLPLLTAAADEDRPALQTLWSALLANVCIDEGRKVRLAYFETVRKI